MTVSELIKLLEKVERKDAEIITEEDDELSPNIVAITFDEHSGSYLLISPDSRRLRERFKVTFARWDATTFQSFYFGEREIRTLKNFERDARVRVLSVEPAPAEIYLP